MEITTQLNLVGWSIIVIGLSIAWWMSKKEQKDIDAASEFLHQSIKIGDHILIAEAQSKSKDLLNKRIGIGGSHSVRIALSIIGLGFFIANILLYLTK